MSDVRQSLIQAGVDLLEAGGLAGLSLRRIAHVAGVSHGAPRHHFPTYESLLAAIARAGVEDLDAELMPWPIGPNPRVVLAEVATTYLDFARRRPGMFELITRHDLLDGAGGQLREITGRWLAELIGLFKGDKTRAMALWSGVHGLALLTNQRTAEPVVDAVPPVPAVLAALIDGLMPPG